MRINKTVTVGLLLGWTLGAGTVFADDDQFPMMTAQWWQVITSIPTTVNPLIDTTGADCMVGQRGPVWLLTGSFFGGTLTRNCSIPAGEWLFVPVINSVNVNAPNVCGQGGPQDVAFLRAQVAPFIDAATKLSVKVDGQAVKDLVRVKSAVFAVSLPADNIFNAPCGGGVGTVPAGVYSPAIDDGYYTLLPPLSAGKHTLHIHSESTGFSLDVTYHLTIVPVTLE